MTSKLRVSDKLARRGEASFTLLLPEADPEQTQRCIERITELIEDELEDLKLSVGSCSLIGKECVDSELLAGAAKGILSSVVEAEFEG
jgi:GGDEF domain-containing protein